MLMNIVSDQVHSNQIGLCSIFSVNKKTLLTRSLKYTRIALKPPCLEGLFLSVDTGWHERWLTGKCLFANIYPNAGELNWFS